MEKVYTELIKKGLKTLDSVPAHLREKVERLLDAESGGDNG